MGDYSVFYGVGKAHKLEDLECRLEPHETGIMREAEALNRLDSVSGHIGSRNYDALEHELVGLFIEAVESDWDMALLETICRCMENMLMHLRQQNGLSSHNEYVKENRAALGRLFQVSDICTWFIRELKSSMEYGDFLNASEKVRQIIRYIHRNYGRDITIEEAGKELKISAIYLSQIFKKETNRTFLEYLTEYRMEKAKKLLVRDEYKIYEISANVGYTSSQYFSQVFKKFSGMTPLEFRKGCGHGVEY